MFSFFFYHPPAFFCLFPFFVFLSSSVWLHLRAAFTSSCKLASVTWIHSHTLVSFTLLPNARPHLRGGILRWGVSTEVNVMLFPISSGVLSFKQLQAWKLLYWGVFLKELGVRKLVLQADNAAADSAAPLRWPAWVNVFQSVRPPAAVLWLEGDVAAACHSAFHGLTTMALMLVPNLAHQKETWPRRMVSWQWSLFHTNASIFKNRYLFQPPFIPICTSVSFVYLEHNLTGKLVHWTVKHIAKQEVAL